MLVRTNEQGRFVARELQRWYGDTIPVYEVGQQERQSHVPVEMLTLLQFCDRPHSPDNLKNALATLVQRKLIPTQDLNAIVSFPEQMLYPGRSIRFSPTRFSKPVAIAPVSSAPG